MDEVERIMARERARWRAKTLGKPFGWGFENWPTDPKERHHVAREKYGEWVILLPVTMHRELTRRQIEEHPDEGPDPDNPVERTGRLHLGVADIYECCADLHRLIGETLIRAAIHGTFDLKG
jgi:hypothetical protein